MSGLLLVLLTCFTVVYGKGPVCNSCAGVPLMEDCSHTVTCGEHEECYTRKTVGTIGNVMYESGCISKQVCSLINGNPGKRDTKSKRDSVTCFKCCDGDLCNRHLCSHDHNTSGLECFACKDVMKPEQCTELKSCGLDYECFTSKYMLDTVNEYRFKLDCFRKVACHAAEVAASPDGTCVSCCSDSYCNTKLCGFIDTAKPIVLKKPQDRVVKPNDNVTLNCQVAGIKGLDTTITWEHKNAQGQKINAPTYASNGNQSLTMTITGDHYGYWTCRASNKNGYVEFTSKITPPPFVFPGTGK